MYIYRNYTIELLFQKFNANYSGYGDISTPVNEVESDLVVFFYNLKPIATSNEVFEEIKDISVKVNFLFNRVDLNKSVLIILPDTNFFNKLVLSSNEIAEGYIRLKAQVIELSNQNKRIKYVEFNDFTKRVGQSDLIDWKYYYTSEVIVNPKISTVFTQWFSIVLNSINFKRKKCIVLDCDNTLWGGGCWRGRFKRDQNREHLPRKRIS